MPNKQNAVTMAGSFMRDRATNECATVYTQIARKHADNYGVNHSLGDSCGEDEWFWEDFSSDGTYTRQKDTCFWGEDDHVYISSRILELSHSNNTFLQEEGNQHWEYMVRQWAMALAKGLRMVRRR